MEMDMASEISEVQFNEKRYSMEESYNISKEDQDYDFWDIKKAIRIREGKKQKSKMLLAISFHYNSMYR